MILVKVGTCRGKHDRLRFFRRIQRYDRRLEHGCVMRKRKRSIRRIACRIFQGNGNFLRAFDDRIDAV